MFDCKNSWLHHSKHCLFFACYVLSADKQPKRLPSFSSAVRRQCRSLSSRDLTKNEIWPQHIYLSHPSEKGEDSVTFLRAPPFFFPHLSTQALISTLSHSVKKTLAQRELHPILQTSKRKILQHLRIPFRRNVIIFQHGFSHTPNTCHSKIFAITHSRVVFHWGLMILIPSRRNWLPTRRNQ